MLKPANVSSNHATVVYDNDTQLGCEVPEHLAPYFDSVEVVYCPSRLQVDAIHSYSKLIWWEWVSEGLVYLTKLPKRGKLVVRGRAGDILPWIRETCLVCREQNGETVKRTVHPLKSVEWANVDRLLFCAPHLLQNYFGHEYPDTPPMGVFLGKRFHFKKKTDFPLTACVVARIHYEKEILKIIKAVDQVPGLQLHIMGANSRGDEYQSDKCMAELMDHVAKNGSNVVWHPWGNPYPIYDQCSIIINFSVIEGIANSVMEGMSRGCAPVCRHWRHAEELYGPGCVRDEAELVTSLAAIASNVRLRKCLSNWALDHIMTHPAMGSESKLAFSDILGSL